jgi:C-5 cytosine-specific DNA methylase
MSSHCSGQGSADIALQFITIGLLAICSLAIPLKSLSACVRASAQPPHASVHNTGQDVDTRCQRALKQLLNPDGHQQGHVFCDLWDMVSGQHVPPGMAMPLGQLQSYIGQLPLSTAAFCVGHGRMCRFASADLDTTGTPCQDFSGCGGQAAANGPQMAIFLLWCHLMLARQTAILVHENVPEFWASLLDSFLGHSYWIFTMVIDCADVGFYLISRKRRYTIMYHKAKCRLCWDPRGLYTLLTEAMQSSVGHWNSQISDCFLADYEEIATEVATAAARAGISVQLAMQDLSCLLTPGELARLSAYITAWIQRFGHHPSSCPWAIFNLRDNPEAGWLTWSACSRRIPGLRTGQQRLWSPFLHRWLTCKELLAAMGVPVYPQLAMQAGMAMIHVAPGPDAWHMLGNMMHIASVGTAMFVALASATSAG